MSNAHLHASLSCYSWKLMPLNVYDIIPSDQYAKHLNNVACLTTRHTAFSLKTAVMSNAD
jgi:hypothetical protein